MNVVFRVNLGSVDAKRFGLDYTKCKVGKSVKVSDDAGAELTKSGVAVSEQDAEKDPLIQSAREEEARVESLKPLRGVARPTEITGPAKESPTEEESPVSDDNAAQAIDKISRMVSTDKLTEIVNTDSRETVKRAAQKRLDELQAK